jgi:plasmid stabilization system protein ParE
MRFRLRFRMEVPHDIAEARRWYKAQGGPALSNRFARELKATLARIGSAPQSYAQGNRGVRTAMLHVFPYVIHFRFTGNVVDVLAVMYGGRNPSAWSDRT